MKNVLILSSLFFISACSQAPQKPMSSMADIVVDQHHSPVVEYQEPHNHTEDHSHHELHSHTESRNYEAAPQKPESLAESTAIYSHQDTITTTPRHVQSMNLKYGYYTYDQQKLGGYKTVENLMLFFPAISGQIFGDPTDYLISSVNVTDNDQFVLQLPRNLDSQTQMFTETSLNVVPASASILRVATYHLYPSYNDELGGGGFINSKTDEPLILMYFSEPVQITGSLLDQGETFNHNIKVDRAGWHWIQVSEPFNNHFELSLFKGPTEDIEFMVLVTDVTSV